MSRLPRVLSTLLVLTAFTEGLVAAEAPQVRSLRTQRVGETTYFHVCFDQPREMYAFPIVAGPYTEWQRQKLTLLPRLVPQDGKTRAVYQRLTLPHFRPVVALESEPRSSAPITGLEFVGQVTDRGPARFLLLYPAEKDVAIEKGQVKPTVEWDEVPVDLDLAKAKTLGAPRRMPGGNDLKALWAEAQAARFAILEALSPGFSFYGFACAATGRKYLVPAPALEPPETPAAREALHRQLYETTTGAAAITASLQSHRLLHADAPDRGRRTVDVWQIPGIDIAEHPWKKMIGDRQPAPEPLAQWVPRDNYYVRFNSLRKLIDFAELLDQWGTNVLRAYEVQSRDYQMRARYERQLCLKSTWLGKTLGPAVVRGVAITGSDAYLREGSDVTVIFHVRNRVLFLAAVDGFIEQARKECRGELKETRADYHSIPIEVYVTPLREVSLHRALVGDFVLYSNSPTGLRRALDAHHRRLPALADSLDYQYMRTVFRADDPEEDGFAFLSDAFIRQLVGPVSKIKEKRRLEALTSLGMLTNAALFVAWERGVTPWSYLHSRLQSEAALKPEYLYVPEGKGVTWDSARRLAVSDAYNTLHFATPLIELPIDKVTPAEEREYLGFREEYTRLWRRYFDPVGLRLALDDRRVKVETFILPLIQLSEYRELQAFTGGGTAKLDPRSIPPQALLQYTMHLSPNQRNNGMGDWLFIRLDDGPELRQLAEFWIRWQSNSTPGQDTDGFADALRLALRLPLTVGIRVADRKEFQNLLEQVAGYLGSSQKKRLIHQHVPITRVRFDPDSPLTNFLRTKENPPVLYHAFIDDVWYVSLREASIKQLIDRSVAGKKRKAEGIDINTSLYLSPAAAEKARDAIRYYLEWESRRRALANDPIWYALYRAGVVADNMPQRERDAAARHYLGYVPVSPEAEPYAYGSRTDDVVNRRHGSLRVPQTHLGIDAGSPLDKLLNQFRTLRADLRFREDGVHTVLTLERSVK